jgi:hypothetical protein
MLFVGLCTIVITATGLGFTIAGYILQKHGSQPELASAGSRVDLRDPTQDLQPRFLGGLDDVLGEPRRLGLRGRQLTELGAPVFLDRLLPRLDRRRQRRLASCRWLCCTPSSFCCSTSWLRFSR